MNPLNDEEEQDEQQQQQSNNNKYPSVSMAQKQLCALRAVTTRRQQENEARAQELAAEIDELKRKMESLAVQEDEEDEVAGDRFREGIAQYEVDEDDDLSVGSRGNPEAFAAHDSTSGDLLSPQHEKAQREETGGDHTEEQDEQDDEDEYSQYMVQPQLRLKESVAGGAAEPRFGEWPIINTNDGNCSGIDDPLLDFSEVFTIGDRGDAGGVEVFDGDSLLMPSERWQQQQQQMVSSSAISNNGIRGRKEEAKEEEDCSILLIAAQDEKVADENADNNSDSYWLHFDQRLAAAAVKLARLELKAFGVSAPFDECPLLQQCQRGGGHQQQHSAQNQGSNGGRVDGEEINRSSTAETTRRHHSAGELYAAFPALPTHSDGKVNDLIRMVRERS